MIGSDQKPAERDEAARVPASSERADLNYPARARESERKINQRYFAAVDCLRKFVGDAVGDHQYVGPSDGYYLAHSAQRALADLQAGDACYRAWFQDSLPALKRAYEYLRSLGEQHDRVALHPKCFDESREMCGNKLCLSIGCLHGIIRDTGWSIGRAEAARAAQAETRPEAEGATTAGGPQTISE